MIVSGFKIPIEFLVDAYIYEITHGFREICTVKVSLPEIDLAKELKDYYLTYHITDNVYIEVTKYFGYLFLYFLFDGC